MLSLQVRGIGVSPLDPTRTWLATWGSGVWQRASDGAPWQHIPTTALPADHILSVAPDPYTAHRVLVGTGDVYLSTDGATFTAAGVGQNPFDFAFDPTSAGVLYAATQLNGIYKLGGTTDAGAGWVASNTGLTPWIQDQRFATIDTPQVVVDPAAPQTLYIGTVGRGVFKSSDGAQSWSNVLAPAGTVTCLVAVAGPPTSIYACVQGMGVQVSKDGGVTWADVSTGLPTEDVNGLTVDPTTGNLYAAINGGVLVKAGAAPWADLGSSCLSGVADTAPTIVARTSGRSLLVGASGSVYAHPL